MVRAVLGGAIFGLGHLMARKTTTKKSTAKPTASAPAAPAIEPTISENVPVVAGPVLRKKDFIDRAVERSGLKKKDVKPAIEAALAVMAEALDQGEELVLQPLGKVKIVRQKDLTNGKVMTARIRMNKAADDDSDTAEADDVAENDDSALEEAAE
jgi:DNA-binding protein HU-alpha